MLRTSGQPVRYYFLASGRICDLCVTITAASDRQLILGDQKM